MNLEDTLQDEEIRFGVVDTGVANLASVMASLRRVGVRADLVSTSVEVERVDGLVLPGVGHFASGMSELRRLGLVESIRERVRRRSATLAICLGTQLLADSSDEAPGVAGLGAIDVQVRRLAACAPRPHVGWSRIDRPFLRTEDVVVRPGTAYFANGYALDRVPDGWAATWACDGDRFVASLECSGVVACQFHPELSGIYGQDLIRRWVACVKDVVSC